VTVKNNSRRRPSEGLDPVSVFYLFAVNPLKWVSETVTEGLFVYSIKPFIYLNCQKATADGSHDATHTPVFQPKLTDVFTSIKPQTKYRLVAENSVGVHLDKKAQQGTRDSAVIPR